MMRYHFFKAVLLLQFIDYVSAYTWYNWQYAISCRAEGLFVPEDEKSLVRFLQEQHPRKSMLKVVGKGHAFGNLTTCAEETTDNRDSYIISLDNFNSSTLLEGNKVKFGAGWSIEDLVSRLRDMKLSVTNLGNVRVQNFVGAFSTGTHGTGDQIGNIATQVVGFRVLDTSGKVTVVDENTNAHFLPAFRISLGALGIITEVTIQAQPITYLKRTTKVLPTDTNLDKMYKSIWKLHQQHDRLQKNGPSWTWDKSTQNFTLAPEMMVLWWHKIPGPAENLPLCSDDYCANGCGDCMKNYECYDEVADAVSVPPAGFCNGTFYAEFEHFTSSSNFVDMAVDYTKYQLANPSFYVGFPNKEIWNGARFLKGDDSWMSPVHTYSSNNSTSRNNSKNDSDVFVVFQTDWFPAYNDFKTLWHYQELIKTYTPKFGSKYTGRPHWGKMSFFDGSDARKFYPALPKFLTLQRKMDPFCQLVNEFLVGHLGMESCRSLFPSVNIGKSEFNAGNDLLVPVNIGNSSSLVPVMDDGDSRNLSLETESIAKTNNPSFA